MRPFAAASIAFSLLLLISLSNGRTHPGEYWKAVMNGEAIPQVVKDLLHQNEKSDQSQSLKEMVIKDFDTKPNVIIYHKDVGTDQEVKSSTGQKFLKDFDTKPNVIIYHKDVGRDQEVKSSTGQKFLKDFDTKPNVIIYHRDAINLDEVRSWEDKEKLAVEESGKPRSYSPERLVRKRMNLSVA